VIPSDGSALDSEPLAPGDISGSPFDASPDGAFLLFRARAGKSNSILPLGGGTPRPWPGTPFMEIGGDFSPDGRLAAYVSDASGQLDVWLSPFPGPGAAARVSADGGVDPVWSRDGRELFYRNGARLLSAKVTVGAGGLRVETPRVLFEGGFVRDSSEGIRYYDAAADGRLLMLESAGDATVSVVLVRHWVEELARRIGS
jgi:serine/threonine-protein kinase